MAYNFRERSPKNYKKLATVALPRAQRTKAADPDALYRVEVLERDDERVKVHWIGYTAMTKTSGSQLMNLLPWIRTVRNAGPMVRSIWSTIPPSTSMKSWHIGLRLR